jgi:hypothetical protein
MGVGVGRGGRMGVGESDTGERAPVARAKFCAGGAMDSALGADPASPEKRTLAEGRMLAEGRTLADGAGTLADGRTLADGAGTLADGRTLADGAGTLADGRTLADGAGTLVEGRTLADGLTLGSGTGTLGRRSPRTGSRRASPKRGVALGGAT